MIRNHLLVLKIRELAVGALLLAAMVASATTFQSGDFSGSTWYMPYNQLVQADYSGAGKDGLVNLHVESADGTALLARQWPATGKGRVQVKAVLPNGTHLAVLQLLDETGVLCAAVTNKIVCRSYSFEHNGIGEDRIVIPPFEPVNVRDSNATVWEREFTFSPSGLPQQIVALDREILASGGVRLILNHDGQQSEPIVGQMLTPTGSVFSLATSDGYDATGRVCGVLGPLQYQLDARLEYDGSYFVRIEVDSGDQAVPIDRLTLLIPFTDEADTFSFQKNDQDLSTLGGLSRFDGIRPDQQGVIFDARQLPSFSAYDRASENSFVPAIYVGSGTRGLWYYADSDWDWYLNPKQEHATLERVDGCVQLRILLVNDRVTWHGKRVFEFVLMPQPVKPMPVGWRKVAWGYPKDQYIHDTSGWRYYGDGVNGFSLPTDDDYRSLERVLAGEVPLPAKARRGCRMRARDDQRPLVLYGSSLMAGSGPANGEWDTFAAEWAGATYAQQPFDADVRKRFGGLESYGGFDWDKDISLQPCVLRWTDSWLDFSLQYQQKLVALARVNGTWFDNQSCFTIPSFDEQGRDRHLLENPQRFPTGVPLAERPINYGRRFHILQFREYLKRLVTMCHQAGVRPFWLVNQHPTWSFAQMAWHVEADFYMGSEERDLVEHLGVNGFRAHVCTQGGLIGRLQSHGVVPDQPPREGNPAKYGVRISDATAWLVPGVKRTHTGLCLVHDTGMVGGDRLVLAALEKEFGFFDDCVTYQPYWDQDVVQVDSDRVYCSVFKNPDRKLRLAVIFNEKKGVKGLTVPLSIATSGGGVVRDMETGEPLVDLDENEAGLQTLLYIPPRNFRLVVWNE
jgi:hypothetical protein